jgi:hypothetical protein
MVTLGSYEREEGKKRASEAESMGAREKEGKRRDRIEKMVV